MSVLSQFQTNDGKYMVILHYWLKPYAKKRGMRYTTIMLLFLMHEIKRPIRKEEWKQLVSSYSFGYGAADVMLLESLGFIKKVDVRLDDLDKANSKRRGKSVMGAITSTVEAHRYEILPNGERFAEMIKEQIAIRMKRFEMKTIRSMRELTW